jgi:hypothetical protein
MRAEVSSGAVVSAVRELVAESDGEIEGYWMYSAAARRLDIDGAQNSRDLRRTWLKFNGQVFRALARLADEGVLIKAGANQRGPDGTYSGREVRWYTPDGWKNAEARGRNRRMAEQEESLRWAAIRSALSDAGIIPGTAETSEPRLTQDQWEKLIALAWRAQ